MTGEIDNGGRANLDVSRYDLILAVIPLAFVLGVLVSGVLPVPLHGGMALAAAVGGIAVVDAIFLNPPVPRDGAGG